MFKTWLFKVNEVKLSVVSEIEISKEWMKISWSIKYKKKKLNSNNAKDVAFQDMVVLSNESKFLEVSVWNLSA